MRSAVVIVDAADLLTRRVVIRPDAVEIDGARLPSGAGWLRRLAPEDWASGVTNTGAAGAARSAAVSALAAMVRADEFRWLTPLDALGAAENKPFQYRRAAAVGVPVPDWLVTTDPSAVPTDGEWVSKPLGRGSFIDERGSGRVVPTARANLGDPQVIARVPFILQRLVQAKRHARVVTVKDHVWSATLSARDLPLDWRMSAEGHQGFSIRPAPTFVHRWAIEAARSVGVSFSSQDWIQDHSGMWWFVDLNPAGQWLFLPQATAAAVTADIAKYLEEGA